MNKNDKVKQVKLTLEDTLFFQKEFRELLKVLISENRPLSFKEKNRFFEMLL